MKFFNLKVIVFLSIIAVGFCPQILANQSKILQTSVENLANSGNAGLITCRLKVTNPNTTNVIVDSPQTTSLLGYMVKATPSRIMLNGGQTIFLDVQISITKDGKFQVLIPLSVRDQSGAIQFGSVKKDLYFKVTRSSYTVSNYRSLFMNPYARQTDDSGKTFQMYRTGAPPAGWKNSPEFNIPKTDVEQLENMSRDTVFTTDWSEPNNFSSKAVFKKTENPVFQKTLFGSSDKTFFEAGNEAIEMNSLVQPTTAKGTLVYTGADGLLQPAYGWLVSIYKIVNGNKSLLKTTTVKYNGKWETSFTVFVPTFILIEYQPRNRFFSFADVSDNTFYSFSSNTIYQATQGGTIDESYQSIYMAGSDLIYLGELYNDGMILWNALKRKGRGISPLRDVPITIYYPNDEYDCGREDGEPWSCHAINYSHIWIIPEHATTRAVMIHELAHQIHAEYWNDDIPGSGEHPPFECTTRGSALTEGFADYMVHWARFDKNSIPSGADTYPIENPSAACTIPAQNQLWISATFWDLYDNVSDGDDNFLFANEGSVIGIFLQNPGLTMMPSTFLFYANAAPQFQQTIFNIYDQNHQNIP